MGICGEVLVVGSSVKNFGVYQNGEEKRVLQQTSKIRKREAITTLFPLKCSFCGEGVLENVFRLFSARKFDPVIKIIHIQSSYRM